MNSRPTFQGWILLGCLLVVLCTLVFVGVVLERSLKAQMVDQIKVDLQRGLEMVETSGFSGPPSALGEMAGELAGNIVGSLPARATLIDPKGKVLADSEIPPERLGELENLAGRAEVAQALETGRGEAMRYNPSEGVDVLYVARRMDLGEGGGVVIRLAMPLSRVAETVGRARRLVLGATLLGILLSVGVAYLVSRGLSGPVRQITQTATEIAAGDLSRRFRHYPSHEIGDLGRALDLMADNLEARINDVTKGKERLETILRVMVEGVVVVDPEGRVVLANRAAQQMLEVPAIPVGRHLAGIIRQAEVLDAVQEVRQGRDYAKRQCRTLGKAPRELELHVVALPGAGPQSGAVAVLHDVTERNRLDQMRRDFVANVSHELRTPLTAIRGSVETLQDGALDSPQYARHFLDMIARNSARLERLTRDLLELSGLESRQGPVEQSEVALAELADEVLATVSELAEGRGVELECNLPREPVTVLGDRSQLEEALLNLMDNAVKYTPEGGRVALLVEKGERDVRISVKDTGIGIPSTHLPRIFERFYRVDKDRSREVGGTGLGLAIVKHIVQAHRGRVQVDSRPGRGSTFTIVLPQTARSE